MPWKEESVMNQRREFVFRSFDPGVNFSQLCQEFGISRKTGYKWKERFLKSGDVGLSDESRRPLSCAHAISADIVCDIIRLKLDHPSWGPGKIRDLLLTNYSENELPHLSTVKRILDRVGLVKRRKKRLQRPPSVIKTRIEVNSPNDLWTVDFKGWWLTLLGQRCEPLTVRDEYSRYILAIQAMETTVTDKVKEAFVRLFEVYGLPKAIRSDNGSPFAAIQAAAGLSQLSAWWVALGIQLDRIEPGKPYQNGSHERMHRDMRAELQSDRKRDLKTQQKAFDLWRHEFNHIRPHEALQMKKPASIYQKSKIEYKGTPDRIIYPYPYMPRKVNKNGHISYNNKKYHITRSLREWQVGLKPISSARSEVWFDNILLGEIDEQAGIFIRRSCGSSN